MNAKLLFNKGLLKCKKHSPEILIISGIVGLVGAGVMACKATLKVDEVLESHKENMDKIHEVAEREDIPEYSEKDLKKDTAIQYFITGKEFLKLYGPSILVAGVSITAILCGNNILRKRCAALAAAYTATDAAFKKYRERVVNKYGEEEDRKLYFGEETQEIEETDEKGKEKKVKKEIATDPYKKYITRANPCWEEDEQYMETFFQLQQNFLNDLLKAKGFLTLNEVYRELGIKETNDGMVVGWIYDPQYPNGDNYIELRVHKITILDENGKPEDAYEIDFNCDGLIYDLI